LDANNHCKIKACLFGIWLAKNECKQVISTAACQVKLPLKKQFGTCAPAQFVCSALFVQKAANGKNVSCPMKEKLKQS